MAADRTRFPSRSTNGQLHFRGIPVNLQVSGKKRMRGSNSQNRTKTVAEAIHWQEKAEYHRLVIGLLPVSFQDSQEHL